MQRPASAESPDREPPTRAGLFVRGALGLPVAILLAAVVEGVLRIAGSDGSAPGVLFAAVAALTLALALGLLVQLLTALAGRTKRLVREVRRFDEEMSREVPELVEESHRDRVLEWQAARLFVLSVRPFGAGVLLQLVVTEVVAIVCLVSGIDERYVALALCVEVVALIVYLVSFNAMLGRMTQAAR